ncbi:DNA-binding MarR family transcriptional regulator [Kineococcus xinjiangensis]|uniref:DNA-binding MarR family transcriptional regulator n=1 Tax=Kineococcus xinjiangensis TaxID=512762 RepID=A0A2S6IEP3_9ACTN|nr:MarR family transcriptional regulator [Kineococcus xinjiangensis]PPK92656.1 DNA-binding MarR family transcriptional regulator [Kineococcus xinjiangensis]
MNHSGDLRGAVLERATASDVEAMASFGRALIEVGKATTAWLEAALASWSLTPSTFGMLRQLSLVEVATCSELATALKVSRPRVSAVSEDLVRAGLIERVHPAGNRRVVQLRLSAQGHERVAAVTAELAAEFTPAYTSMSSDERAGLVRALNQLSQRIARAA